MHSPVTGNSSLHPGWPTVRMAGPGLMGPQIPQYTLSAAFNRSPLLCSQQGRRANPTLPNSPFSSTSDQPGSPVCWPQNVACRPPPSEPLPPTRTTSAEFHGSPGTQGRVQKGKPGAPTDVSSNLPVASLTRPLSHLTSASSPEDGVNGDNLRGMGRGPRWSSGSPCCSYPPSSSVMSPIHQQVQGPGTRRTTVSINFGCALLGPAQSTSSPAPAGWPLSSQTLDGSHCPLKKDPAPQPSRKPHPRVYGWHLPFPSLAHSRH